LHRVLELPGHIVNGTEFERVHRLHPEPLFAIHESRVKMVEGCIPPAETVIDLGGAAHGAAEGALLLLGYPHIPARITIVDLDPNERLYLKGGSSRRGAETVRETVTHDGIRVVYHYGSMSDLSPFPDESVDLVFCGESIEHVWPQVADCAISEAFRVLRPGGSFCLDTPNAELTRLQSPESLIHPEHKYEYKVEELRAKVVGAGFEIVRELGVCAMPRSRSSGTFDEREMLDGVGLCDDPRDGYLFFIEAQKPS
jgi:SAM-dependent methyltransferase